VPLTYTTVVLGVVLELAVRPGWLFLVIQSLLDAPVSELAASVIVGAAGSTVCLRIVAVYVVVLPA
jgi:hypothetical protein